MQGATWEPTLELGLATRAAWLSYVGGYRQEDIAERLGVSRIKVNRLIALAHRRGLIRVVVEGSDAQCVALEKAIAAAHGLAFCAVAVDLDEGALPLRTLAAAGARFLARTIENRDLTIVGIGHGRTLAAVVEALPRLPRTDVRFVSLLGSLTRHAAANPFDVVHRIAQTTGCESYFMPVPFFANSVADKQVLMAQKSLKDVFDLALQAQLYIVGIGEVSAKAHMVETRMITMGELAEVERAGAVGEVLGHFVDARGRPVGAPINERALGLRIEDLRGKEVIAIAGGHGKARAIDAVLSTGVLTGLITDEATADRLVARRENASGGQRAADEVAAS
ncbi:MAG: sugar-binding transcriptional regulator [Geminicoccaceae bacterium]